MNPQRIAHRGSPKGTPRRGTGADPAGIGTGLAPAQPTLAAGAGVKGRNSSGRRKRRETSNDLAGRRNPGSRHRRRLGGRLRAARPQRRHRRRSTPARRKLRGRGRRARTPPRRRRCLRRVPHRRRWRGPRRRQTDPDAVRIRPLDQHHPGSRDRDRQLVTGGVPAIDARGRGPDRRISGCDSILVQPPTRRRRAGREGGRGWRDRTSDGVDGLCTQAGGAG